MRITAKAFMSSLLGLAESYGGRYAQHGLDRSAAERVVDRLVDVPEVVMSDQALHRQATRAVMLEELRKKLVRRRIALDATAHGTALLQPRHLQDHLHPGSSAARETAHAHGGQRAHRCPQRASVARRLQAVLQTLP